MAVSKLIATIGTLLASVFIYVICIGYRKRLRIYRLRQQGIAMPDGWSWWFGHLLVLDRQLKQLPPDANVFMAMEDLIRKHEDTECFVMDYWPMFQPVLMTFSPEIATQISDKYNLPKPADQEGSFRPVVGGPSLLTMNGKQWKFWRSLFRNGFSASHMLSLVPALVDSMDVFCEQLSTYVEGELCYLDDMFMSLSMDIIIKTTLDKDLDNQRAEHQLAHALNTILNWHSFWDPRILLNPLRIPIQWYYGRVMDNSIKGELQKRFEEMKSERTSAPPNQRKKTKSVIALALEEHISQQHTGESDKAVDELKLDPKFANIAANQIRMFLFAGNDSTATTLCYVYHLISQSPSALNKLREEHDGVFHSSDAGDQLRKDPSLINQCPYTLAVIKEAMRLYPPSSSMRDGVAGVSIVDRQGNQVPTGNLSVTIMHRYIHVHPRFWPRPLEFIPERWLVEPGHELYPNSHLTSFRPFEHGPRNCIAQTLVYNEIRVALIMTARRFDINPAYDEWDARENKRQGVFSSTMRKLGLKGEQCKTVRGERAYQTTRSGAHPADRYPCRVSFAQS